MTALEEVKLILAAGNYLRARGTPVTPAKVESYVFNTERSRTMATQKREFLTPKRRDGTGGEVVAVQTDHPAPAQQYAQPEDYFAEPRLSESRRAELESQAEGIRAQLRDAQLTPANRIRLEQDLIKIERTLGKTGGQDERRTFAR